MTAQERSLLAILAELGQQLPAIRERATLACAANPLAWLAVHGVCLADYLAKLDELAGLCREATDKLEASA